MSCPRLGPLTLGLALAAAGCVPNKYYVPPPQDTDTDAGTSTTAITTSMTGGDESTTSTTTTSTSTSTTTTSTTEPATTTDVSTDTDTDSSTTDPLCPNMMTLHISGPGQIEDAFFTLHSNPDLMACDLGELDQDFAPYYPCGLFNSGALAAMRVVRKDTGPEVMYAMTFALEEAVEVLKSGGNTIIGGKVLWTMYGQTTDVTVEIGAITSGQTWLPGVGYGAPTEPGDIAATFNRRVNGNMPQDWLNMDGPRGASTKLCEVFVPSDNYDDHLTKLTCDFDPAQIDMIAQSAGLVLYYPQDGKPKGGPGIKSTEAEAKYQPYLDIDYCPP